MLLTQFVRFNLKSSFSIPKPAAMVQTLNHCSTFENRASKVQTIMNCLIGFENNSKKSFKRPEAQGIINIYSNILDLQNCSGQRYIVHVKALKI